MFFDLPSVRLKNGEVVSCGVVDAPDAQWQARIESLLKHKGEPWNAQNRAFLTEPGALEARFYVLHRGGAPFCHILISRAGAVGILGHVWTTPENRGWGAAPQLLQRALADFDSRGGLGLYLGVEIGSAAQRLYQRAGFTSLEADAGLMFRGSSASTLTDFEREFWSPVAWQWNRLSWEHFAASAPLFAWQNGARCRFPLYGVCGATLPESALIEPIMRAIECAKHGEPPRAWALQNGRTRAVGGIVALAEHPARPDCDWLDVWCHDDHWNHASAFLKFLDWASQRTVVAYCEGDSPKWQVLQIAGFCQVAPEPHAANDNWECVRIGA